MFIVHNTAWRSNYSDVLCRVNMHWLSVTVLLLFTKMTDKSFPLYTCKYYDLKQQALLMNVKRNML